MPKKVTPLTDAKIKASKPQDKTYTLSDGDGLHLLIKNTGSKIWEFVFISPTLQKRRKMSFGIYPDVTLVQARKLRSEYREQISNSIDPMSAIKEEKETKVIENVGQFHLVVEDWIRKQKIVEVTRKKKFEMFRRDVFPYFSKYDANHNITSSIHISEISHHKLLEVLEKKAKTAQETAYRLLSDCRNIWQYAYEKGYLEDIVTAKISKKAIPKPSRKHFAKITDEIVLGELQRAIDNYTGQPITRLMLKFLSLIPLRADNLTKLTWDMIDFENQLLTIPRANMKIKDTNLPDFILPLPHQTIKVLQETKEITGWGKWVFHGFKNMSNPINNETANKALRVMGFNDEERGRKQTTHSFRGTFRSLVETHQSEHKAEFTTKERVLDHHEGSKAVRAYTHKADYTEQMRDLLQWWADFIDGVKSEV